MKLIKLIIILLIVSFVILGSTSFIYYHLHKPEVIIVSMDLTVEDSDVIGFNSDTDALHFGTMPPGSRGNRIINISNNQDYPIIIQIAFEGDLAPLVIATPNPLIIQPDKTSSVLFEVTVPVGAKERTYNGTAYIIQRRA